MGPDDRPLTVALATDKRDLLFPSLSRSQRLALQLDEVAMFSVTDEYSADRITELMVDVIGGAAQGPGRQPQMLHIVDAFGCVGGNTMSFARHEQVGRVDAIELDEHRCDLLRQNLDVALAPVTKAGGEPDSTDSVLQSVARGKEGDRQPRHRSKARVHRGDCVLWATGDDSVIAGGEAIKGEDEQEKQEKHEKQEKAYLRPHMVFLDPPWGGTTYTDGASGAAKKKSKKNKKAKRGRNGKWVRPKKEEKAAEAPIEAAAAAVKDEVAGAAGVVASGEEPQEGEDEGAADLGPAIAELCGMKGSLAQFILQLAGRCDACCLRLPNQVDLDAIAAELVAPGALPPGPGGVDDRPLPFRMQLGSKATLLVVCFPPRPGAKLVFGNGALDKAMGNLAAFDKRWTREHHPKFFDFEARAWIRANTWKGCKMVADGSPP
eukprot:g721.t1